MVFKTLFGRFPTYREYFGLWQNRDRNFYQRARVIEYGVRVALGFVIPGMDYYRANGQGEMDAAKKQQEAHLKKMQLKDILHG